jgi:hypothetical protein
MVLQSINEDALGVLFFLANIFFLLRHPKREVLYPALLAGSVIGLIVDISSLQNKIIYYTK